MRARAPSGRRSSARATGRPDRVRTSTRCSPTRAWRRCRSRRRRAPTTRWSPRAAGRQARAGGEAAGDERRGRRASWSSWRSESGLVLMPGHTFLYSPAVNKVRELIDAGRARRDLLRHLVADEPRASTSPTASSATSRRTTCRSCCTGWSGRSSMVAATGCTMFQTGVPETAFLTLRFEAGPPPTCRSPGSRRARCARW